MQDEVEVGDVFKEVYNALNEDGVFIFDVHSTYQTDEVSRAIPTMKMQKTLLCFGIPMRMWHHSIVHELTFFVQEEDGSFSRHDEVSRSVPMRS